MQTYELKKDGIDWFFRDYVFHLGEFKEEPDTYDNIKKYYECVYPLIRAYVDQNILLRKHLKKTKRPHKLKKPLTDLINSTDIKVPDKTKFTLYNYVLSNTTAIREENTTWENISQFYVRLFPFIKKLVVEHEDLKRMYFNCKTEIPRFAEIMETDADPEILAAKSIQQHIDASRARRRLRIKRTKEASRISVVK